MIVGLLKNFVKARRRPKYGSKEDFACTLQRLIDNPSPDEPYVAPCGGTGNHSAQDVGKNVSKKGYMETTMKASELS